MIDNDTAWAAVLRRDRSFDGRFVTGVLSTGIYCKPSCSARHPARRNVKFFADPQAARAAGLRACRRCLPDDISRDELAIKKAIELLGSDDPPELGPLAEAVGYAPHHFHRLFKKATGATPGQYARGIKAIRAKAALESNARVTDAIYDAGYSGPSRFYEDINARLGMTPGAWRSGGAGVTIRWAITATSLGQMLVAITNRGICRLSFDECETELHKRFPNAEILPAGKAQAGLIEAVIAAVDNPGVRHDLPLDVAGTAFQEAVWNELRRIPAGETRSYGEIAAAIGKPNAVRAVGSANGANNVAVLIPCHRVVRSDGSLGGYAYGIQRKKALLEKEEISRRKWAHPH